MRLTKTGNSGTLESSDISITMNPIEGDDIVVNLSSVVIEQFGEHIEVLIKNQIKKLGVEGVEVTAKDRGALDCTIIARVQTAVSRGCESSDIHMWGCNDEA